MPRASASGGPGTSIQSGSHGRQPAKVLRRSAGTMSSPRREGSRWRPCGMSASSASTTSTHIPPSDPIPASCRPGRSTGAPKIRSSSPQSSAAISISFRRPIRADFPQTEERHGHASKLSKTAQRRRNSNTESSLSPPTTPTISSGLPPEICFPITRRIEG